MKAAVPTKKNDNSMLKHKRRYCRVSGCTRIIKSQGVCQRHGAKPKSCKIPGCEKQSQGTYQGMCKAHARKERELENCSGKLVSKASLLLPLPAPPPPATPSALSSSSGSHKPVVAINPVPTTPRRVTMELGTPSQGRKTQSTRSSSATTKHNRRLCKVAGCRRVVKSQGVCQRHGAVPVKCRVQGCRKQAQGSHSGMCKSHFQEFGPLEAPTMYCQPIAPAAKQNPPLLVSEDDTTVSTATSSLPRAASNKNSLSSRSIQKAFYESRRLGKQGESESLDPYAPIRLTKPARSLRAETSVVLPTLVNPKSASLREIMPVPLHLAPTMDDPDFCEAIRALLDAPPEDSSAPMVLNPSDWFEAATSV